MADIPELLRFAENPGYTLRPTAYLTSWEGVLDASIIWPLRIERYTYLEAWRADFRKDGSVDVFKELNDGQLGPKKAGLEVHELTLFAGVAMRDMVPGSEYALRLAEHARARLDENQ